MISRGRVANRGRAGCPAPVFFWQRCVFCQPHGAAAELIQRRGDPTARVRPAAGGKERTANRRRSRGCGGRQAGFAAGGTARSGLRLGWQPRSAARLSRTSGPAPPGSGRSRVIRELGERSRPASAARGAGGGGRADRSVARTVERRLLGWVALCRSWCRAAAACCARQRSRAVCGAERAGGRVKGDVGSRPRCTAAGAGGCAEVSGHPREGAERKGGLPDAGESERRDSPALGQPERRTGQWLGRLGGEGSAGEAKGGVVRG